jgi:hypothetical protein
MAAKIAEARRFPFFTGHFLVGLFVGALCLPANAQESQDNAVATEHESEIAPDSDGDANGELSFTNLDQAVDERLSLQGTGVVLQGLDKITARVSTFSVPLDELAVFGSLQIMVRACFKTPPEDAPENAAFLEIVEQKPDSEARKVFGGWMFSSSPAVSALEHPVYDVWVHNCILPGDTDFEYSSGDEVGEPGGASETPEGNAGDSDS